MGFRNNKKGFIEHLSDTYSRDYCLFNESIDNLTKIENIFDNKYLYTERFSDEDLKRLVVCYCDKLFNFSTQKEHDDLFHNFPEQIIEGLKNYGDLYKQNKKENSAYEKFLERFEKKELEGSMKSFGLLDPLSGVTKFEDSIFGVSYSFIFLTLKNILEDEIYPKFQIDEQKQTSKEFNPAGEILEKVSKIFKNRVQTSSL